MPEHLAYSIFFVIYLYIISDIFVPVNVRYVLGRDSLRFQLHIIPLKNGTAVPFFFAGCNALQQSEPSSKSLRRDWRVGNSAIIAEDGGFFMNSTAKETMAKFLQLQYWNKYLYANGIITQREYLQMAEQIRQKYRVT